jgi:hypothetical protein
MGAIEAALPRDFGDDRQVEFVKQYLIGLKCHPGRHVSLGRRIHRSNPQSREVRRFAGRAVHQIQFVINLQTAQALGLDVPNSIQLLADQLIEWRCYLLRLLTAVPGTSRTSRSPLDIPLIGVKRSCRFRARNDANDPRRSLPAIT